MKKSMFGLALLLLALAAYASNVPCNFQFFNKGTTNTINNKPIWVFAQKSIKNVYQSKNEIYIIKLSETTDAAGKATYQCNSDYIPVYASGVNIAVDVIIGYIWEDAHPQAAIPPTRQAAKIVNFQADQLNKVYLPTNAAPPSQTTPVQSIRTKVRQQVLPKP